MLKSYLSSKKIDVSKSNQHIQNTLLGIQSIVRYVYDTINASFFFNQRCRLSIYPIQISDKLRRRKLSKVIKAKVQCIMAGWSISGASNAYMQHLTRYTNIHSFIEQHTDPSENWLLDTGTKNNQSLNFLDIFAFSQQTYVSLDNQHPPPPPPCVCAVRMK